MTKYDMIERKFIDSIKIDDYEIETDEGWIDAVSIHKTIPYEVCYIKTNYGKFLYCADTHILFDDNFQEKYAIDCKIGDIIMTCDGNEEIIEIEKLGYKEYMYDIELCEKSSHRYYTNGILSHNTLLAKKLAEELFGSETAMVRFDMSEYSDKTGVNKLIGSGPGYVGYEEGGLLTEAIKNKKHCILLLDEIEKADNEIFNIFLQVFDEGFLTDNTGQKVDFRNVIILLTSNVGAKEVSNNSRTIGFNQTKDDEIKKANSILEKELKKRFAPEFLNRLDSIIYFNQLNENSLKQIVKLEIDKSVKRFKDIGYNITYNEGAIDHIFNIIKNEDEYGARPIIRAVQNEIEDPLTDAILDNSYSKDISIEFNDKEIIIS